MKPEELRIMETKEYEKQLDIKECRIGNLVYGSWDKPNKSNYYHKRYIGIDRIEESFDYESFEEAESRTINHDKAIIFEIL